MILLYACLVAMTLIGSVASMYLKRASGADGIKALIINKNLYIGGFLYLSSALMNIWLLRYLDYSVVLPLTSLTYVWTMVISKVTLGEIITKKKIMGVVFIFAGAIIISL